MKVTIQSETPKITDFKTGDWFVRPASKCLALVVDSVAEEQYSLVTVSSAGERPYAIRINYTRKALIETLRSGQWCPCEVEVIATVDPIYV
jgi:hypothetical protein